MNHILDISIDELKQWLSTHEQPGYRAAQIRKWLFHNRADSFESMNNLPNQLKQALNEDLAIWTSKIVKHQSSSDGTEKLLLELHDGGRIECVLLRDGHRRTICISTQVGCAMGCVFCASGLDGVDRNLTTGEIIEQSLKLQSLLPDSERLSHVVVMGMGEPLANLDQLLPALDTISSEDGLGISARRITISTVGLPKAMHRLSDMQTRYHLAVSLHAPNDPLRNQLVPVNDNIGIKAILSAADRYFDTSGRRLTYEYVLLGDVNDGEKHAQELVDLLHHRNALLNVIPYNPVDGLPYKTPSRNRVARFRSVLEAGNITIRFRQRKGDDINAACGQLRRNEVVQIDMPNG